MADYTTTLNQTAVILLNLSVILFSGFGITRLTKKMRLPNVSGFILAGILIGPYALNLVPPEMVSNMDFVNDIALSFIAFGVGKFFKLETMRSCGRKVFAITFLESSLSGLLVTLSLHLFFGLSWSFSLIAGAIASATAPASTIMTIKQYRARGEFVNLLLQVMALDNVIALLAFGVLAAVEESAASGTVHVWSIALPVFFNLAAIGTGALCAYLLKWMLQNRSKDNRLILTVAMLLGISGMCSLMDISPLLSCMMFGAVFINITADKELFLQVDNFTPPVFSCFFILSGMRLDILSLKTAGLIGVAYFLIRIFGKYAGAYLGCAITKTSPNVRNYLGVTLIPQAGVSIGLALLGQRLLPADLGNLLSTVILTAAVLYELVGPVCAKAALCWSGAIQKGASPAGMDDTAGKHIQA